MPHEMTPFDQFWAAYPRKVSKFKARAAWDKALTKHGALPEAILEGLERAKRVWARMDAQYTPYPASWLNAGGWEDELEPSKVNGHAMPEAEVAGWYAEDGSPELAAWDRHWKARRGVNAPRDKRFGYRFPTRWPPS